MLAVGITAGVLLAGCALAYLNKGLPKKKSADQDEKYNVYQRGDGTYRVTYGKIGYAVPVDSECANMAQVQNAIAHDKATRGLRVEKLVHRLD